MSEVRLFLCGDVMLGRGIDQILRHPSPPRLYEPYAESAMDYVHLAEQGVKGVIPRHVGPAYVWGDALAILDDRKPDARIINLETAITKSEEPWPKGINYRMHPDNVGCLTAAQIDCCVVSNNHVIDWGWVGLLETLATLKASGISIAGAGENATEAAAPAVLRLAKGGRAAIYGLASTTSGVSHDWAATAVQPGVNLLPDLSVRTAASLAEAVQVARQPGDLLIASVHWGGNWGYDIPHAQRAFAHGLVDGGFDIVHGHSSHHPKGVEVYRQSLILYGSGDFINDYEGISGYEEFHSDLTIMYMPRVDGTTGHLISLEMVPMQIRRFRLNEASNRDVAWLYETVARESASLDTKITMRANGAFGIETGRM